jgi:hypothetical protein
MWRVIVRISYTGDTNSFLRNNYIMNFFNAMGLQRTATGTFESQAVDPVQAAQQLGSVLRVLSITPHLPDIAPGATLQHLWVYIDRA